MQDHRNNIDLFFIRYPIPPHSSCSRIRKICQIDLGQNWGGGITFLDFACIYKGRREPATV